MATPITSLSAFINIGTNRFARITDQNGNAVLPTSKVMEIQETPERQQIKVEPINAGGTVFEYSMPQGHRGKIVFAREDSSFDIIQSNIESAVYAGNAPLAFSIYLITYNMNGTVSESLLSPCDLWITTSEFKKNEAVMVTVDFYAQRWTFIQ